MIPVTIQTLFTLMMTPACHDAPEFAVQIKPELLALMRGGHQYKLTHCLPCCYSCPPSSTHCCIHTPLILQSHHNLSCWPLHTAVTYVHIFAVPSACLTCSPSSRQINRPTHHDALDLAFPPEFVHNMLQLHLLVRRQLLAAEVVPAG